MSRLYHTNNLLLSVVLILRQFFHGRPWISPLIQSISTELDIIIHVIASQSFRHCDVINNRLWGHKNNVNRLSETRGPCVKIIVLIVSYGFVNSCVILFFSYPRCFATREIDTKKTLSWAQKKFATRESTSFSIYVSRYPKVVLN